MKLEIDSQEKVNTWLRNPTPAIFQGQDLIEVSTVIASKPLSSCVFLGCKMGVELLEAAAKSHCLIFPIIENVPYDAFTPGLYTPDELYDKFDVNNPEESYKKCLDWRVYDSFIDSETKQVRAVDVEVTLGRRIHDTSISDALAEFLDLETRKRSVAIMGGHDVGRDTPIFAEVARLCQRLTAEGYLILTGGGPGLMEAANLGAYSAGFSDPGAVLDQALNKMKESPSYADSEWLLVAYKAWKEMGTPTEPDKSQSVGIPTWFYGHEPPNVFATHIAKYFENSVREEGLLAIALAGIVFAQGNAGTVQEIFQDACQNYYRTYNKQKSPMILFGIDYWVSSATSRHNPEDKRKGIYSVLEKLACEKDFSDMLLTTDNPNEIVRFIKKKSPVI